MCSSTGAQVFSQQSPSLDVNLNQPHCNLFCLGSVEQANDCTVYSRPHEAAGPSAEQLGLALTEWCDRADQIARCLDHYLCYQNKYKWNLVLRIHFCCSLCSQCLATRGAMGDNPVCTQSPDLHLVMTLTGSVGFGLRACCGV